MDRFKIIDLSQHFNSTAALRAGAERGWDKSIEEARARMPRGEQCYWGIPFELGPEDMDEPGVVEVSSGMPEVQIPLSGTATHVCIVHFCNVRSLEDELRAVGELVANYVLTYKDAPEHTQPIRRRFELNSFKGGWREFDPPFASVPSSMPTAIGDPRVGDLTGLGWADFLADVVGGVPEFGAWVYALENPYPKKELAAIRLLSSHDVPVAVLGITRYNGPGHPLRHLPRRVYSLTLPAAEKVTAGDLDACIDMGAITRVYAAPAPVEGTWLKAEDKGLGELKPDEKPTRELLVEATAAEGATLTVKAPGSPAHELPVGQAFLEGEARSPEGEARIHVLYPRSTWTYVTVVDESTGKPTPTRVHFRGSDGRYLPPYGHHDVINENWFEDYGGDLQLGGQSFAYVPGRFQTELPVGEVYAEISKGFEYEPVRTKLQIAPGQRELQLTIPRPMDLRSQGWVTADPHVHFIGPQTAWLEGQAEGLNLVNVLATQFGRLFTNVADITGALSGCSAEDTLVWVGTENRHHLLGHISLLGAHGDPVYPMCGGGPREAYLGDPDFRTMTEWARECRERDGVVIQPHFPHPSCEEPVHFLLNEVDAAELRFYGDPDEETLYSYRFAEWYRYLNCGCRVAAVGGTDKMSAGMPVGGARTYAKLKAGEPLTFESWAEAVRAGRTYTTSGPLMTLTVDGREMGEEIRMSGPGTLEVEARADCIWPLHLLEVVVNGQVVASSRSKEGASALSLKERMKIDGSCWIAARASSSMRMLHCWPAHVGAHTSPVYVMMGGRELFSPSDATYMMTLIDGGMTYLDTLSVRYDEERHRQMKALFERAKLELQRRGEGHW